VTEILHNKKENLTLWPESASALYRRSDSSLSAKLVPNLADIGIEIENLLFISPLIRHVIIVCISNITSYSYSQRMFYICINIILDIILNIIII
jgi:hypothetical protein